VVKKKQEARSKKKQEVKAVPMVVCGVNRKPLLQESLGLGQVLGFGRLRYSCCLWEKVNMGGYDSQALIWPTCRVQSRDRRLRHSGGGTPCGLQENNRKGRWA